MENDAVAGPMTESDTKSVSVMGNLPREDAASFLKLLGHDMFWFHAFNPSANGVRPKGDMANEFCSRDRALELIFQYDRKGIPCVALNDRNINGTLETDVTRIKVLAFDLDVRDARKKDYASTDEDHAHAQEKAVILKKWLESIGYTVAIISDSGNGAHLFLKVDIPITNDVERKEFKAKATALELEARKIVDDEIIKLDFITKDINRRIKVPGTHAFKDTSQKVVRISKITYIAEDFAAEKNNALFSSIQAAPLQKSATFSKMNIKPAKSTTKKPIDTTQSGTDWGKVCNLLEQGILEFGDVDRIMRENKCQKWIDSPDHYRNVTFSKAKEHVLANKQIIPLKILPAGEEGYKDKHFIVKTHETKDGVLIVEEIGKKKKNNIFEANIFSPLPNLVIIPARKRPNMQQYIVLLKQTLKETYADQYGAAWAFYLDNDKRRYAELGSQNFEDFARVVASKYMGQPKNSWIKDAILLLQSEARRRETRGLQIRVAQDENDFYIHINEFEAVKINEAGQITITDLPGLFRVFPTQENIEVDLKGDHKKTLEDFKKFLFETDEQKVITIILAASYFIPNITIPALFARGTHGSGKSFLEKILAWLCDPQKAGEEGRKFPQKDDTLMVMLKRKRYLFLDNMGTITADQQDVLCRLVTGFALDDRALWTNYDVRGASGHVIVLVNGVEFSLKADLADRALLKTFNSNNEERKQETVLIAEFQKDKPKIMGMLIDLVARARKIEESKVKIPKDWRLKDWGSWASRIAQAMGISAEDFNKLLERQIEDVRSDVLSGSLIAQAVLRFADNLIGKEGKKWEGSATELLKELTTQEYGEIWSTNSVIEVNRVNRGSVPLAWPKDPRHLGQELTQAIKSLRPAGLVLESTRTKRGTKWSIRCEGDFIGSA